MVSAYGLLDNLTRVVVGPTVGGYVDRHERMPGCKLMLRLQNCCIGGSAAAALALLWPGSPALTNSALYWPLIWVLTVLGAASSAGSTGVQIAVEREAVKALCGDDAGALASTNATMRAIDLTALLLAPLAAGVLMTAAGPFAAAAAMSAYCCLAYIPEVLLLGAAFRAAPALMRPKATSAAAAAAADAESERVGLLAADQQQQHRSKAGSSGRLSRTASIQQPLMLSRASSAGSALAPQLSSRRSGGDGDNEGGQADTDVHGGADCGGESDGLLLPGGGGSASQPGPGQEQQQQLPTSTRPSIQRSGSARSLDLHIPEQAAAGAAGGRGLQGRRGAVGGGGGGGGASVASRARALLAAAGGAVAEYGDSWRVYVQQPLLLPCLALALIYMTVLSLGFLMTSFLKWTGLTEAEVSVYRGIGALTGLAATVLFPPLSKWAGLRFCAAAGITYQLACLAAGVVPVALTIMSHGGGKPSVGQVRVMVGGLVSSRTGLWMYDLAVTQLIQQGVAEDHMGAVYGVQSSLQATFEMLSFVAGLLSPDPAHFHWLMLGSVCSVGTAACLVWVYVCSAPRQQQRGQMGARSGGGGGGGQVGSSAAAGTKGAGTAGGTATVVADAVGGTQYQAVPAGDDV
ncbi:hypothetical protein HXX76_006976 [Chlamydomonas incerta]|uniref:Solute carrier family 40 member n=1 Tax=Chlamydomonas incerta TaxID=51695 RepID=A0A835TBE0_CHLIN|nr:hypothetical protein HXX76_006976 [Chlamydomonas incerta]|eukprot:KAG2435780.1 hypothetical protein HXX76_006976 [Chlamydomonas incerta]